MSVSHDQVDAVPDWFKRQPKSPVQVYKPEHIMTIQRVLHCKVTGEMDTATVSHIMGLQSLFDIKVTGIIDEATAIQIERIRNRYAV